MTNGGVSFLSDDDYRDGYEESNLWNTNAWQDEPLSATLQVNDGDTPWYLAPKTTFGAVLVFLCIVAFCLGVLGNCLCIFAFAFRRRSCLTVDVGLVGLYICILFLLLRSLTSFHLQFMINSHEEYANYHSSRLMVCVLPYGYAAIHMAVFYILTLIAFLQYLNIAWPQYALRPRHIVAFLVVIVGFSLLVNVHFLLVHCHSFEFQLYIEYIKTVWLKFIFVDGSAFILALVFLIRTLVSIRSSSGPLPDRHILRDDCLAVMLVLFTYATPVFVDALFALIELYSDERLLIRTIHYDLVLTLHIVSLACIPLVTATTRPATRLDVNSLFDRWRNATDDCCFPRSGDSEAAGGDARCSISFGRRLRLVMSGENSNGAAAILGESADGGFDDRLHILSISPCTDDMATSTENCPLAPSPPPYVRSNLETSHEIATDSSRSPDITSSSSSSLSNNNVARRNDGTNEATATNNNY